MINGKIAVLYIDHSLGCPGGATLSLYNLVKSVKDYVYPIVVVREHGDTEKLFLSVGCEVIVSKVCSNVLESGFIAYKKFIPHIFNEIYVHRKLKSDVLKLLNGRTIDIVHSNTVFYNVGFHLSKALKTKHIWHVREMLDISFGFRPFWGWNKFFNELSQSDSIIAITKAVFDHNKLDRYSQSIYLWDAVMDAGRNYYDKNKSKYLLFCAAGISECKGLDSLLNSYALSGLKNEGYRLRVIGKFDDLAYKSKIMNLVETLKLRDYIDFLGYCKDISSEMKKATAIVMSSYNEGLGRVAVEAMFYGCPVIARNCGGPAEFLTDGDNAHLFLSDEECASCMKAVVCEDQYEMTMRAQQYAIDNFSEEVYGKKIFDIYRQILKL